MRFAVKPPMKDLETTPLQLDSSLEPTLCRLMGRGWLGVAAVLVLGACGGSSSPVVPSATTAATPSSTALSVGGTYAVSVALADNTCGAVTVLTQPTSVTHTPGASRFSLAHGSNTFLGAVAADGSFMTDPLALNDGGSVLSVSLLGRFTTGGLTAVVTVDVRPPMPASPCRYLVQWTGTKQGTPNVIP